MIKNNNRIIYKLLGLLIISITYSCGLLELVVPGYHIFEIENKTESDINIFAYEKSKLVDQLFIKKNTSFRRFNEDYGLGNNPSIFITKEIDSIVVINEQRLGFIQFCNYSYLIDNSKTQCSNIKKNLMHLYINGRLENFDKKTDGHRIVAVYSMSLEPPDFLDSLQ